MNKRSPDRGGKLPLPCIASLVGGTLVVSWLGKLMIDAAATPVYDWAGQFLEKADLVHPVPYLACMGLLFIAILGVGAAAVYSFSRDRQ